MLKDITLGQYFPGNSVAHKLDPRTKLILVVVYIAALFLAKWFVSYALMAAGGDLGGSVAPQLLGVVVDTVSASGWANQMSASLSLSPEQIGMKVGMLVAALFPLIGVVVLLFIKKRFVKRAQ